MPASVVQSAAGSPLCLELWQSGALICCHNTLLLSNSLAPVLVELQAWAASGKQQQKQGQVGQAAAEGSDMGVTDFVADLADWMHFAEAKQQQSTASEGAQMMSKKQEEDVQSMAACGMDLLYSAVRGGMVALSGACVCGCECVKSARLAVWLACFMHISTNAHTHHTHRRADHPPDVRPLLLLLPIPRPQTEQGPS